MKKKAHPETSKCRQFQEEYIIMGSLHALTLPWVVLLLWGVISQQVPDAQTQVSHQIGGIFSPKIVLCR